MISAKDIGLKKCIDEFKKLNEVDKKWIEEIYRNREGYWYLRFLITLINRSDDCTFWFVNEGDYTRFSTAEERGFELLELISFDYNNLSEIEEKERKLDLIIGSLFKIPPIVGDSVSDLEKRIMGMYFKVVSLYVVATEKIIKLFGFEKKQGRKIIIDFLDIPENGPEYEVYIGNKKYRFNSIVVTDTYLNVSCVLLYYNTGHAIVCDREKK